VTINVLASRAVDFTRWSIWLRRGFLLFVVLSTPLGSASERVATADRLSRPRGGATVIGHARRRGQLRRMQRRGEGRRR
jgi:hypothetical protein